MTIFGTRRTPREWTAQLASRLMRSPGISGVRIEAPLHITLSYDDYGPLHVNATASYEAYQRTNAGDAYLLDATTTSIMESFARLDAPPTWEEARAPVTPRLLRAVDAADCLTCGMFGDLTVACTFMAPITGETTFVTLPAWGVDRDTLLRRALTNLDRGNPPISFRPLPDTAEVLRLLPVGRDTASRVLLPAVQHAITARVGDPAVILIAARDAVFICPLNALGDPPPALRSSPIVRAALNRPDALSERPIIVRDCGLASRRHFGTDQIR